MGRKKNNAKSLIFVKGFEIFPSVRVLVVSTYPSTLTENPAGLYLPVKIPYLDQLFRSHDLPDQTIDIKFQKKLYLHLLLNPSFSKSKVNDFTRVFTVFV